MRDEQAFPLDDGWRSSNHLLIANQSMHSLFHFFISHALPLRGCALFWWKHERVHSLIYTIGTATKSYVTWGGKLGNKSYRQVSHHFTFSWNRLYRPFMVSANHLYSSVMLLYKVTHNWTTQIFEVLFLFILFIGHIDSSYQTGKGDTCTCDLYLGLEKQGVFHKDLWMFVSAMRFPSWLYTYDRF